MEKRKEKCKIIIKIYKKSYLKKKNKIYQYIKDRRHITWIIRLRIEYYILNKYLYYLNIINDLNCEYEK